jgi:two-component system NtrC family sensor kinase
MQSVELLPEATTTIEAHEWILRRTSRIIEQSKQLAALNAIASSVSQSLDFHQILNSAIEEVLHLMELDAGLIFLTDKSSGELTLNADYGLSQQLITLIDRLRPEEEFIGSVVYTGEPLVGEIAYGDGGPLSRHLRREGFRFFVAIPLKAKGDTLGVMVLTDHRPRHVDLDSSQFLVSVGSVIGMAIENATLYRNIGGLLEETKLQAGRLRESEQQFRAVIENATDAVAIIQDGQFRYVNPYGLQMLGPSASNIPGLSFLDVVHQGYRELVARNYARRLQGEVIPPYDVVVVREDGTELLVSLNACLIEYERRPAVLIIARDITESKLLREQVLQSEKMAALGQLISGVAHELNNPLTAVIGYSELLRQEEHLPGILQRGLDTIYDSARRAGRIVQNLLTFARQHRGARLEVNINELLERTLALRAYQLRVNNIEVVKELALNLPPTVADGYQLQQVFLNLIINAEQAMLADHGRGRLVIRTQKLPSPDLPSSVDAERIIEIAFSDDGPGIPAAHLNRIFDPFFTTKPVGQGTGLGLSISHSIIHDHGGRIHVRSQPGSGATFIIELPVVRQTGESVTPDAALPLPPKVTRKNVLIVDDEPTIVSLLREIVAAEGHRVDVAANGAQALTKLQQQPYDLIFCDIKMPYLNGRELYQEMKQCNGALTQKMVFVTGDVIGEETRTFLEHTGSRFIEKPFMADDVIRVMRSVLTDEKQNTSEPVAWRANRG